MYWTRLVLVRPAASLYSASPPKHHPTGKQWCLNPDHYPYSEPARLSAIHLCWALSRVVEPQILTPFVWRGRGSNHQSPAFQANSQPLHYTLPRYDWKEEQGQSILFDPCMLYMYAHCDQNPAYAFHARSRCRDAIQIFIFWHEIQLGAWVQFLGKS